MLMAVPRAMAATVTTKTETKMAAMRPARTEQGLRLQWRALLTISSSSSP